MRYKLLGKSGLRVSELVMGTMTFGEEWGWGASKAECKKMVEAFAKAGGNFIDTANRYTEGTSEKIVGELIHSERDYWVLATKYTLFNRRNDPNASGNQRKNMMQSVEESLKRLNTDYIDLFWLHAWDYMTPVEEIMRGLDDLVRSGKVHYIGVSDSPAWEISRANMMADLRGWSPFVALQTQYSLVSRTGERDLLPMARKLDLAVTPWAVLGSGVLTGKFNKPDAEGRVKQWGGANPHDLEIAAVVVALAEEIGCTPSQVAIAWVRQQPGLILPLIGARTVEQLDDNLGSLKVTLNADHLARLDEISRVSLGFPFEWASSKGIRDIVYGGTYDKIDNHRAA